MSGIVIRGPSYPGSEIPDARHALHVGAFNFVRSVKALRSPIPPGNRAPALFQSSARGLAGLFEVVVFSCAAVRHEQTIGEGAMACPAKEFPISERKFPRIA